MNKYDINLIDLETGYITVTFNDDVLGSSQMTLAHQLNGTPFTLSNVNALDAELLASYDNWIANNLKPAKKEVDPKLLKYTSDAVIEEG